MPAKIRLQRHGRKRNAFYHIVVADARAKRDGRLIERIGSYNPNTNPATIELNFDGAISWLEKGAQPTDTARAILSYKGVMLKRHLNEGVKKGALTEEQAEKKFQAWMDEKAGKIDAKSKSLSDAKVKAAADRLAAEAKVNEERAAAIAAKNSELNEDAEAAAEEAIEEAAEAPEAAAEEATEEATEEAAPEATEEKTEE